MTEKLLRRAAVENLTGMSRSSLYFAMSQGDFPRPLRIGKRAVAWRQRDIEAWQASLEVVETPPA